MNCSICGKIIEHPVRVTTMSKNDKGHVVFSSVTSTVCSECTKPKKKIRIEKVSGNHD